MTRGRHPLQEPTASSSRAGAQAEPEGGSHHQATAATITCIATACDGAFIGIALAICAAASWVKYIASSSALRLIRAAPFVLISDLRSVVHVDGHDGDGGKLVVVRGDVQPKSSVECTWIRKISGGSLLSQGSGERAVIVQQSQTVPFILVEGGYWPNSGYVHVSLDGSNHPLPLTTVYHHLHPVQPTPYSLFRAVFGDGYPVALLDEEKILPVGKQITAIGICRAHEGALEIKPCADLPCFLSDKKKEEIEVELAIIGVNLAINSQILFWTGITLGTLSIGILGYDVARNWWRLKEWKQRRRQNQSLRDEDQVQSRGGDEESGDIPDGQLCVICLTRQRRCVFWPCGHLVCCPQCAMSVELDSSPKCPVCRQTDIFSIRIYDS